jgi:hypothetical protein
MAQRDTWQLAGVAALLLAPGACEASVQVRMTVGWLGTGDWQLRTDEGQVYLVKSPYKGGGRAGGHRWAVSNPTIKAPNGTLLGYDAKGRDPSVSLVKAKGGKGASTRWSFETVSAIVPGESKKGEKEFSFKEGPFGMTFRAMAAEGPYKGWYLATKDDGKGKKRLMLVREKKNATAFKYIDVYYDVR